MEKKTVSHQLKLFTHWLPEMTIVSMVFDAASLMRQNRKNRSTLYKYINNGRLSVVVDANNNAKKLDTSELLRVFGNLNDVDMQQQSDNINQQQKTKNQQENDSLFTENQVLKTKIEMLERLLDEKDKHNEDLRKSLLLLEHKIPIQTSKKHKKLFGIF